MRTISVAEVLKMYGKWIEASEFASLVADKLYVSERQAYNLVKEAVKDKEVLRVVLPNRSVLYGLPEFGPLTKPTGHDDTAWKEHALQQFSRIRNMINSSRDEDIERVPEETLLCIRTLLPPDMRDRLKPEITELKNRLKEVARSTAVPRLTAPSIMRSHKRRNLKLIAIAHEFIPEILEKTFALLRGDK